MLSRSSIIASFVVVTILTAAGVEFFCRTVGQALSVENRAETVAEKKGKSAPPPTGKKQSVSPAKRAAPRAKENYAIITQRSLFGKTAVAEKPVKKDVPEEKPLQETSLNLVLRGTVSGADNMQRAIIQDKKKNTQDLYYQGDAIGSTIIKEVRRGEVVLTVNGKDEILRMEELKSGPVTKKDASLSAPRSKPKPVSRATVDSIKESVQKRRANKPKYTPGAYPRRRLTFKSAKKQETDK